MTLRFIEDTTEPEVWRAPMQRWRDVLVAVHTIMRVAPWRDDHANDWTPDFTRDCQGKVSAAMQTLWLAGFPLSCMRGYVGGTTVDGKTYDWHAVLVVRVRVGFLDDILLDHLRAAISVAHLAVQLGWYTNVELRGERE